MKRREVLKYAASAVIGAPLLSTVLFGSTSIPNSIIKAYKPVFFTPEQLSLIKSISDTILPKTDSPSASDVGVPEKIDSMISNTMPENDKMNYLIRFEKLENHISALSNGKDFSSLSEVERLELLNKINDTSSEEMRWAIWDLKGRTVDYYRKTLVIATEFLNYLPVPGYYDPCISLQEVGGKAWAI